MSNYLERLRGIRKEAKAQEPKYFSTARRKKISPSNFELGKTTLRIAAHIVNGESKMPFIPCRTATLPVDLPMDKLSIYNIKKLVKEKSLEKILAIKEIDDLNDMDLDAVKTNLKGSLGEDFKMLVNKKIFSAIIHGKEGQLDLLEEYVKFVNTKINEEVGDRSEARKRLNPIFGWKDAQGWHWGIIPKTNYVFRAWNWDESGRPLYEVEIYENMMEEIENLYFSFDKPDKPLTVDPFSGDTGVGIVFDKYKNDKQKDAFRFSAANFSPTDPSETYQTFVDSFKPTEDQTKELGELDSLEAQFGRGVFKKSDFEMQLDGLIMFDQKHGYNIFQDSEFSAIAEKVALQFIDEEEEETDYQKEEPEQQIEEAPKEEIKGAEDISKVLDKTPLKVQQQQQEAAIETGNTIEENSFKEEPPATIKESEKKVDDKMAAFRAKMLNKNK